MYSLQTNKIFNDITFISVVNLLFHFPFYYFEREENEQKLRYAHGLLEGLYPTPKLLERSGARDPSCGGAHATSQVYPAVGRGLTRTP